MKNLNHSKILRITRALLISIPIAIIILALDKQYAFSRTVENKITPVFSSVSSFAVREPTNLFTIAVQDFNKEEKRNAILPKRIYNFFNRDIKEVYDFKRPSTVISTLFPENNLDDIAKDVETEKFYQGIIRDPVFFNVELPKKNKFKFVDLEINYKNSESPIFQLGVQSNTGENQFILEPIENKIIENSDWKRIDDRREGVILLQKQEENLADIQEGIYTNFDEFINYFPLEKNIASYNYDIFKNYKIKDYQPSDNVILFNKALRGAHEIVTYVDNENLNYLFFYNSRSKRKNTTENFTVDVYQNNQLIKSFSASDNDSGQNVLESNDKFLQVFLQNPPRGIYSLKIDATSNTRINMFYTQQKIFGFKEKITLDDQNETSHFYINSPSLSFKTNHQSGLQTVVINGGKLEISKLFGYFQSEESNTIFDVTIPKSDLTLKFDGIATENLYDNKKLVPNIILLDDYINTGGRQFDYILSKYYEPTIAEKHDWKNVKKSFNLKDLLIKDNKIKFILSIPGVQNYKSVKISQIKVTFRNND